MKVTLNLTLLERFLCLGIFNNIEGTDLVEWGFINEAQEILAADDETRKKFGLEKQEDGGWTWNDEGNKEFPYELSQEAANVLKADLKTRNKNKAIKKEFLSLAKKVLAE
jgi:hypothetical protein